MTSDRKKPGVAFSGPPSWWLCAGLPSRSGSLLTIRRCVYILPTGNSNLAKGSHPMVHRSLILVIYALAVLLGFCVSFAGAEPKSLPTVVRVWQGLGGDIGTAIQAQVDRFN